MHSQRARLASSHLAVLFAAVTLAGTLTACGGGGETTDNTPAPSPGTGTTPTPSPAPGTTPTPAPLPGPTPPSAPAVPAITTQPTVRTVAAGASATFEVTGTGSPEPTYQWEISGDYGATFTSIAGATGRTYSTPATQLADSGKQYRVVLANTSGSAISQATTLVVGVSAVAGSKVLYATTQFRPAGDTSLQGSLTTFSVDETTGTVSPVVGRQVATGWSPGPIHFTPDGRFGYVRNSLDNSISAYRFDASDRIPVPIAGSPFAVGLMQILGSAPPKIHIHPNGRFLYVIATPVAGSNVVQGYGIDPSTGALTRLAAVPTTPGLSIFAAIYFSTGGACAVANNNGSLYPLSVDSATGRITSVTSTPITAIANEVFVSADGNFIYAFGNAVFGWSVSPSTCALTPIAGSPWRLTSGSGAYAVSDPSRRHFYSWGGNAIDAWVADAATGGLTTIGGSPFSSGRLGAGLINLVYAPNTSRVYVVTDGQVNGLSRDANTGALQALPVTTFASPAVSALPVINTAALDPDERTLYSTTQYGRIWALRIDQQGALSPIGSAPTIGIDALPIEYLVAR